MSDVQQAIETARKVDEIEVTDEMIKAGIEEYCSFDIQFERLSDVLRAVYVAMAKSFKGVEGKVV